MVMERVIKQLRQRPNYWPDRVQENLDKLKRGDYVAIMWVDASESSDVPIKDELPNHSVESISTSIGIFHGVQRGNTYSDLHILVTKDLVDTNRMRIQAIPLCLVKSIEIYGKKRLLMLYKKRRALLHFRDGSVKRIGIF
jgi:hypothetical protein